MSRSLCFYIVFAAYIWRNKMVVGCAERGMS